jgi:hypothetical protein
VSGTVTVPDGMMITLWHSLASYTITPVRNVLATPTAIEVASASTLSASRDTNGPMP